MNNSCYTITFGDRAENGIGMQIIGNSVESGYSCNNLKQFKDNFLELGIDCEYINLKKDLLSCISKKDFKTVPKTSVLVVRGLASKILESKGKSLHNLVAEISNLECDTKCLMRGQVKNKIARHNLCFSDFSQEPNYSQGLGTVINFKKVPMLKTVRNYLPTYFGDKSEKLQAELNYYYDINKCGIGYHGDAERKIVIGMRLGEPIPLSFKWYINSNPVDIDPIRINNLESGDVYIFSKYAVGNNWKSRKIYTIRHAAGCVKYIK